MIVTLPHVLKAENNVKDVSFEFAQKFQRLVDECEKMSADDMTRDFIVLVAPEKGRNFYRVFNSQGATVDAKAIAYDKKQEPGCHQLKSIMNLLDQEIQSAAKKGKYNEDRALIYTLPSNVFEIIKHERR